MGGGIYRLDIFKKKMSSNQFVCVIRPGTRPKNIWLILFSYNRDTNSKINMAPGHSAVYISQEEVTSVLQCIHDDIPHYLMRHSISIPSSRHRLMVFTLGFVLQTGDIPIESSWCSHHCWFYFDHLDHWPSNYNISALTAAARPKLDIVWP